MMKRWIALCLTAVCLCGLFAPAAAAQEEPLPLIYIQGSGSGFVRDDGTEVLVSQDDLLARVRENLPDMVRNEIRGEVTGDFSRFNDLIYEAVTPAYADIRLGKDGLPRDGSHIHPSNMWRGVQTVRNIARTIPITGGQRYPVYRWHYDWRLSPVLLAEELRDLVAAVKAETSAEKVNLITRCYGTNIAYAYLYQFGVQDVNACVFYTSSLYGIGMIDALFTGDVEVDPDALVHFAEDYLGGGELVLRDAETTELALALLELMNDTRTLGPLKDNVMRTVNRIKKDLFPRVLRDSCATYPSYWSMVSAAAYPKARAFIFGGVEEEWAGLLEQTDAYYEMQKNMDSFLTSVSDQVRFGVVAKYGLPAWPLTEDAVLESDGYTITKRLSLGAETARVDGVFSDDVLQRAVQAGQAKYLSADCKINAATALFPDTTWFVKDLPHSGFPDCVNDLMVGFLNTDGMTVETDPAFSRFLQYHDTTPEEITNADALTGYLTPIRTMEDTHDSTAAYRHTFWQTLVRVFRAARALMQQEFAR